LGWLGFLSIISSATLQYSSAAVPLAWAPPYQATLTDDRGNKQLSLLFMPISSLHQTGITLAASNFLGS